jgi:TonB-dependent receptor
MPVLYSFKRILFLTVFVPFIAFGQATLKGTVTDATNDEPLIGVNVTIQGTSLGAPTDIEGKFLIFGIPERAFDVKISCVGYEPLIKKIDFAAAKETSRKFQLKPAVIQGEEVVVTGQVRGQQAAINQQLTANTMVNVVSTEKIQELPDANAAEAIGRLSGVALQRSGGEASQIVLRGMSSGFSTVTIDGVKIPATEADTRGVDLSMMSQSSLAGIELYKALTPDKDADAIAGSVNLVTPNAPQDRFVQVNAKGAYEKLNKTLNQYDFSAKYGERFFNDVLGVQVSGNLEQRDRSSESTSMTYDFTRNNNTDYALTNFTLQYVDETRKRGGGSVILDINTPDNGSIKISNIYNKTTRDFITYNRNYPTDASLGPLYFIRDQQQEISNFNSSINGKNHLFGMTADWGVSFSQSKSDFPYDYYTDFVEPPGTLNGVITSGMYNFPANPKGPLSLYIQNAVNNFTAAYMVWSYYRQEANLDKEKTAHIDLSKQFAIGNSLSDEIKIGGKYRDKIRSKDDQQLTSNYETNKAFGSTLLPDGSIVPKNFAGTLFQNDNIKDGSSVLLSWFLDSQPQERNLYNQYRLYPMINDADLRAWYDINKNGIRGSTLEYSVDDEIAAQGYNIEERVAASYLMNTLNIGQDVTFIAGVRVESENNDYTSKFSPTALAGYPTVSGPLKDTSATHTETIWLPNAQLTVKVFDFMNMRAAAYRALARPDFNFRLNQMIARTSATALPKGVPGQYGTSMIVGDPDLPDAKAWNYEVNTSLFGNTIGLFTVSAFYKDISDMFHYANQVQVDGAVTQNGQKFLDSVGIKWKDPFNSAQGYFIFYPYSSSKPTHVWGLEITHDLHTNFLPGILKNFVISYNFSIVRSETVIRDFLNNDTVWLPTRNRVGVITGYTPEPVPRYFDLKTKLEGQPEFFGNAALGYDIGGFSARISLFFQSAYTSEYSADGRTDVVTNRLNRWDLSLKQQIANKIALMLNINNLTNTDESTSVNNKINGWTLPYNGVNYGLTADLGVQVTL